MMTVSLPVRVFETNLPRLLMLLAEADRSGDAVVLDFRLVEFWIPAAIVSGVLPHNAVFPGAVVSIRFDRGNVTDFPRMLNRAALSEVRKKVEKQLVNDHLRPLQAPAGVSPILKCWMELNN